MATSSSLIRQVNHILAGRGMAGQGKWFVYYAAQHKVDLGLLLGIAGAETSFGDAGTGVRGQYNAFGFMRNGPGTGLTFGSYREAISKMAALMAKSYRQYSRPGKASPRGMMLKYVGYNSSDWLNTATQYANKYDQGKAGKGGGGTQGSYYVNPYARSGYLGPDQGTDWDIKGPIGAVGRARIIRSEKFSFKQGTGWIVSYKLLDGPMKGKNIYVAENIRPARGIHKGAIVGKGQTIAVAGGVYPYIETGWADERGSFLAPYGSTSMGQDFKSFLDHAPSYRGPQAPAGGGPMGGGGPGKPPQQQQPEFHFPQPTEDLLASGVLSMPGENQNPQMEPESVTNMWQSLANLPNSSPETQVFANRANAWGG